MNTGYSLLLLESKMQIKSKGESARAALDLFIILISELHQAYS